MFCKINFNPPELAYIYLLVSLQRKEYFLLQMHLSSLPGLQKSEAEFVDEFKLIFEVRKYAYWVN